MQRTRFVMMGGFLGAGKTTTIARIARDYIARGHRVGLVTNDQASQLVDTDFLRAQGFDVGEVAGACFCCKFNDLVETVTGLAEEEHPDVIVAEPVGSCTDLVATVVEPLRRLYGERYTIAPYVVLLKPEHGRKILAADNESGFSAKAAYIFLKQIEEADVVAINKIDKLDDGQQRELVRLLKERFPDKPVLRISARSGEGFDQLTEAIDRDQPETRFTPDVDYDVYAEGEAELGWLNCTLAFAAAGDSKLTKTFAIDDLLMKLVGAVAEQLSDAGDETAHLKVMAADGADSAVANVVASDARAELSKSAGVATSQVQMTLNARVATDPDRLSQVVSAQAESIAQQFGLSWELTNVQSFRPGRPVPTHRMPVGSSE